MDSKGIGLAEQRRLEDLNEDAEKAIRINERFLERAFGTDYRYYIQETEEKISNIKKEAEKKLKKDLEGEIKNLEVLKKKLKHADNSNKESKKAITRNKKLIASNTKKINKLKKGTDKCYERERKGYTGKKRARCPNGSRKNKSSGKCEKK
jgi:peptidoglycan hydrolase CwlO-like protein